MSNTARSTSRTERGVRGRSDADEAPVRCVESAPNQRSTRMSPSSSQGASLRKSDESAATGGREPGDRRDHRRPAVVTPSPCGHQGVGREVTATARPIRGTACTQGSGHTSSGDRGAGLGIVVGAETCCRCRQNSPAQSHARAAFSPLRQDRRWPRIDGPTADPATGRPKAAAIVGHMFR